MELLRVKDKKELNEIIKSFNDTWNGATAMGSGCTKSKSIWAFSIIRRYRMV